MYPPQMILCTDILSPVFSNDVRERRELICTAYAYLVNSNVYRSVRRGGNEYNGSNDGFGAVNGNNNPSNGNANYGAGLNPIHAW